MVYTENKKTEPVIEQHRAKMPERVKETMKDRSLELKTPFHECPNGRYKVAVKVFDIFGNDTMKIVG